MSIPQSPNSRIHQALQASAWDVNSATVCNPVAPAFNDGAGHDMNVAIVLRSGDFGNGLFVMIDSVTHVLVFVNSYEYDRCRQQYTISSTFELYDSFGIDEDDIRKFGTGSERWQKAVNARKAAEAAKIAAVVAQSDLGQAAAEIARLEAQEIIDAAEGITAWWQLQHQFNYAPLITKATVKRTFTVSTADASSAGSPTH